MKRKDNFILKLLALLLTIGIVFIVVQYLRENIVIADVFETIEQLGLWAPALYILLYILISGIVIPSIVIKVFAGTLFGVAWGIVLVSVAATISSSIKFLLARYLFRGNIQKRIERSQNLKAIDQVIEQDGWKMLLILQNVPVVNSMFLNYICGITKMGLKDFALASFIGRLPTTILYVYLGYIVRYTYKTRLEGESWKRLTPEKIMLFIGLAAIVGASFYLIHLSRKVLSKKVRSITAPQNRN